MGPKFTGTVMTAEHRAILSEAQRRSPKSREHVAELHAKARGRTVSAETRERMSEAAKARWARHKAALAARGAR